MPSQIPASSARTQRPHAHQSVPALDPQRNPIRCSGHQSPTHAACRDDSQAGVRSLHLDADGAACAAKGRGHRSRGNEQGRRPGSADAGHSTSRALAGVRPLGAVRPGAAASEGPPQSRILCRPDPRRGHHRPGTQRASQLQAAADQLLSDPDQVPRRNPSALRPHARPRVPDEGRLLLPPVPGIAAGNLRPHARGVLQCLHAPRARLPSGASRHRLHRRNRLARVPRTG